MGLTVPPTTTTPSGGTTNPPTTESSDTNQQDAAFSQFMARMVNVLYCYVMCKRN